MERQRGVTLILNCHDEGRLAWRSFKAALASLKKFKASHEKRGAQLLIVCDKPDKATTDVTTRMLDADDLGPVEVWRTLVEAGDLGAARNAGVQAALYDTIAFCDADDIVGESWVSRGWEWLQKEDVEHTVVHPQVNLNFERDMLFWQHTDSRDPAFDPSVFCVTNHWTALSMASTTLYEAYPYRPAEPRLGTGFEDWEWNTRTLSAGIRHGVVPETVHFIRKRAGSMSDAHAAQMRATVCNPFWDKRWAPSGNPVASPRDCGDWLLTEWREAHEHEAELFPNPRELQHRPTYVPPTSPAEWQAYHLLNECVPETATHLIFCAGLGGGADLRAAWYAESVKTAGGEAVLFATDGPLRLPRSQLAVPANKVLKTLPPHVQSRVLQRLMRQHRERGRTIHIINSAPAWGALGQNPKLFSNRPHLPKIHASLYARELHPDGSTGGYAFNGAFGAAMSAVDVVFTDNQRMADDLARSMGWDGAVVVPTPIEPGKVSKRYRDTPGADQYAPAKVLWASRMDWNKDLAKVVEIAKEAGHAAEFHVFGQPADWHGQRALQELQRLPNCRWGGPFESFQTIPGAYDVFLFTSRAEGSPNVVAEALAHRLPVVSSEAGHVSALVNVVSSRETAPEWVKAVVEAASSIEPPRAFSRPSELMHQSLGAAGYFERIAQPRHAAA